MIPDAAEQPTMTVPAGGALCGLSRSQSYEYAKEYLRTGGARGLPVIELSEHRRVVPTARLLDMLGLSPERDNAGPPQTGVANIVTNAPTGHHASRGRDADCT